MQYAIGAQPAAPPDAAVDLSTAGAAPGAPTAGVDYGTATPGGAGGVADAATPGGAGGVADAAAATTPGGGGGAFTPDMAKTRMLAYAHDMLGKVPEDLGANLGHNLNQFEAEFGYHGAPWCGIFAGHALEAAGLQPPHDVASVADILNLAQNGSPPFQKGILPVSQVQPGDLVTFGAAEHVAVVVKVTPAGIETIAGNANNQVSDFTYPPSAVTGVVRPDYAAATANMHLSAFDDKLAGGQFAAPQGAAAAEPQLGTTPATGSADPAGTAAASSPTSVVGAAPGTNPTADVVSSAPASGAGEPGQAATGAAGTPGQGATGAAGTPGQGATGAAGTPGQGAAGAPGQGAAGAPGQVATGAAPVTSGPDTASWQSVAGPGHAPRSATVQFLRAIQPAPSAGAAPAGAAAPAPGVPSAGQAAAAAVPGAPVATGAAPVEQVIGASPAQGQPVAEQIGTTAGQGQSAAEQITNQAQGPGGALDAAASAVTSVSSSMLTSGQETFAAHLASLTGLSPRVIAAWELAEESGGAAQARQAASNFNWLNIGYFDSGTGQIAFNNAFSDPVTAAEQTAKFLKGDWGGASASIRAILSSIGQPPEAQISAIANSDWASTHYYGGSSLRGTYAELSDMQIATGAES